MSRNEDVTTAIWGDLLDLSPEAKLLYIWSFTNAHNGMSGLYKIHERVIGLETGLSAERLRGALNELAEGRFMFYEDGVIWVRARVKRLRQRTQQIARAIARDVRDVGNGHPLVGRFLDVYGGEKWLREEFSKADLVQQQPSLTRGSDEPHVNAHEQGNRVSLTRGSGEAPLSGSGLRKGLTAKRALPDKALEDHARARMTPRQHFDNWRVKCNHLGARATKGRLAKIEARQNEGYTDEQISTGIDGAAHAPFINDQGKKFDDIELICRNGEKLESFIERATMTRSSPRISEWEEDYK